MGGNGAASLRVILGMSLWRSFMVGGGFVGEGVSVWCSWTGDDRWRV